MSYDLMPDKVTIQFKTTVFDIALLPNFGSAHTTKIVGVEQLTVREGLAQGLYKVTV